MIIMDNPNQSSLLIKTLSIGLQTLFTSSHPKARAALEGSNCGLRSEDLLGGARCTVPYDCASETLVWLEKTRQVTRSLLTASNAANRHKTQVLFLNKNQRLNPLL